MTWEQLTDGDPMLGFVEEKQIFQWNEATQMLLGNPKALELFYNSEAGRLGFRKTPWYSLLRVQVSDDLFYTVSVGSYLVSAGLEFVENWDAVPQGPIIEAPEPGEFDARGIVWIEVP